MSGTNIEEIYPHVNINIGNIRDDVFSYCKKSNSEKSWKDINEIFNLFDTINVYYERKDYVINIPVIGQLIIEDYGMYAGIQYSFIEDSSYDRNVNYYECLFNYLKNK